MLDSIRTRGFPPTIQVAQASSNTGLQDLKDFFDLPQSNDTTDKVFTRLDQMLRKANAMQDSKSCDEIAAYLSYLVSEKNKSPEGRVSLNDGFIDNMFENIRGRYTFTNGDIQLLKTQAGKRGQSERDATDGFRDSSYIPDTEYIKRLVEKQSARDTVPIDPFTQESPDYPNPRLW
jgi:hypothetical protein